MLSSLPVMYEQFESDHLSIEASVADQLQWSPNITFADRSADRSHLQSLACKYGGGGQ